MTPNETVLRDWLAQQQAIREQQEIQRLQDIENVKVIKEWQLSQKGRRDPEQELLDQRRRALVAGRADADGVKRGLNLSQIPENGGRHQALNQRLKSLTGPMYPDGRMTRPSDISGGPGLLRDSPAPRDIPRPQFRNSIPYSGGINRKDGSVTTPESFRLQPISLTGGLNRLRSDIVSRGMSMFKPINPSLLNQSPQIYEGTSGDQDYGFAANLVLENEGSEDKYYWDPKAFNNEGAITSGVGHLHPDLGREYHGQPLREDVKNMNFANDLNTHGNKARKFFNKNLTKINPRTKKGQYITRKPNSEDKVDRMSKLPREIQAALVSWSFNPGEMEKWNDLHAAVKNYEKGGAEPIIDALLDSKRARQTGGRTEREIAMIRGTSDIQIPPEPQPHLQPQQPPMQSLSAQDLFNSQFQQDVQPTPPMQMMEPKMQMAPQPIQEPAYGRSGGIYSPQQMRQMSLYSQSLANKQGLGLGNQ